MSNPSSKLAAAILDFDEDNPGDPEASIEIPFDVWAAWVDLAGDSIRFDITNEDTQ
jgi:hypothetical protein